MSQSLIAIVNLHEVVEDFIAYLRDDCNRPDMANDFSRTFIAQEMLYAAKVAVNRPHLNVYKSLERTRKIFTDYDGGPTESATDLADELYLMVRNELPSDVAKEKNIYEVVQDGFFLHIYLLVSGRALAYGIDQQSLIDLVV